MKSVKNTSAGQWNNQTEILIGFCGLGFALILMVLYEISGQGQALRSVGEIGGYAVWAYLAFCLLRVVWVTHNVAGTLFGWISAAIDVVSLSTILYLFSQAGTGAGATTQPPVYTLYYVLIAMHAMRLNPIMVLSLGVISILASVLMAASLLNTGAGLEQTGVLAAAPGFMGTEVEKLLSLMMFVVLTAVGVIRARSLLGDAGLKDRAETRVAEFERSSQEKTGIMTSMGEDLRGPMSEVSGMVEALRSTRLSAKQIEFIDIIEKSGGEILSILDDIVDYTKLEMGELQIRPSEFELSAFVENIADQLGEKARAKRLDLITHITAGAPDLVVADEERLRKVLINLIDNAIKYTDEGSILVAVESTPVDGKNALLKVAVKDTGVGISEDRMEAIFAPAAPADGSDKRRYGVMGLGLSVSRGIIRANGGDISVDSVFGKGSEFSFDLCVPYKFQSTGKQSPFKAAKNLNQVQILIVDDAPMCANILEKKLNEFGMMPKIVTSAEQACEAITTAYNAHKPFAFALIDYDMPDWSGLQLAKLIRTREQLENMGIIAVSATNDYGLESSFDNVDTLAFIEKPYRAEDLETALLKALRSPAVVTTASIGDFDTPASARQKSA